jgi:N-acetylmuramoyl-L-alanine amidase
MMSTITPRQMLCPKSKKSIKFPYNMTPTRIVVHNTANDASANNEISYMNSNNNQVSFHFAIDDKEVVQGLPLNVNGWHAGDGGAGKGNREGIGIEICYSKSGGQKFIEAQKLAARFIAQLLTQYGWGMDKVTKHQDYSGKYCPHRTLDMGWDSFKSMIQAHVSVKAADVSDKPAPTSEMKVGDTVIISKGAVYGGVTTARGKTVPAAQLSPKKHTISKIQKNKGVSEALLKEISSWVAISGLVKTKSAESGAVKIQTGATVMIKAGAKSYDSKALASFVFKNAYKVDELKGDRAVLDKKGICTPVNVRDLVLATK